MTIVNNPESLSLKLANIAGYDRTYYNKEAGLVYATLKDNSAIALDLVSSVDDLLDHVVPAVKKREGGKDKLMRAFHTWAFQVITTEDKPGPILAGMLSNIWDALDKLEGR